MSCERLRVGPWPTADPMAIYYVIFRSPSTTTSPTTPSTCGGPAAVSRASAHCVAAHRRVVARPRPGSKVSFPRLVLRGSPSASRSCSSSCTGSSPGQRAAGTTRRVRACDLLSCRLRALRSRSHGAREPVAPQRPWRDTGALRRIASSVWVLGQPILYPPGWSRWPLDTPPCLGVLPQPMADRSSRRSRRAIYEKPTTSTATGKTSSSLVDPATCSTSAPASASPSRGAAAGRASAVFNR